MACCAVDRANMADAMRSGKCKTVKPNPSMLTELTEEEGGEEVTPAAPAAEVSGGLNVAEFPDIVVVGEGLCSGDPRFGVGEPTVASSAG